MHREWMLGSYENVITVWQQKLNKAIEKKIMTPSLISGVSPVSTTDGGGQFNIRWSVTSTDTMSTSDWIPVTYKPGKAYTFGHLEEAWYDGAGSVDAMNHVLRKSKEYLLPDKSVLKIDDSGNYTIEDSNAKVTYQANRIREFSPHLNASDMVAKFVEYAGSLGVTQTEVLQLPLELFVNWLVITAAERDNDQIPEGVVPVDKKILVITKPKCLSCGRYIPRLHFWHNFRFCDPAHAVRHIRKLESSVVS